MIKPLKLETLKERAFLTSIQLHCFGKSFVDKKTTKEVLARAGAIDKAARVSKKRILGDEIANLSAIFSEARGYFHEMTFPWDKGRSLLPSTAFMEFQDQLYQYQAAINKTRQDLIDNLPEVRAHTEIQMGQLFDEKKFPTADEIKKKVSMSFEFEPLSNPQDFRLMLSEGETERMAKQLEAAAEARQYYAVQAELADINAKVKKLAVMSGKNEIRQKTLSGIETALARAEGKLKLWGEGGAKAVTEARTDFREIVALKPKELHAAPDLVEKVTQRIMKRFEMTNV